MPPTPWKDIAVPGQAAPIIRTTSARRAVTAGPELPCRNAPELFFAESPEDVQRAKALCRTCLLRPACLAGALQRGEPCGVWGGELLVRGAVAASKRPRGRPRKISAAA